MSVPGQPPAHPFPLGPSGRRSPACSAFGIVQLVLTAPAGFLWLLGGAYAGTCSDNGGSCDGALDVWLVLGLVPLANLCAAIYLMSSAGGYVTPRRRVRAAWLSAASATALIGTAVALVTLA